MGLKKYDIETILEEQTLPAVPNEYAIKYWSYNRSVSELVLMFDGGEIIIPTLQREYVWSYEQASLFIDSIIRGLPIPSFFITEIKSKYLIIDGLQRLNTLSLFVKNQPFELWKRKNFKLSNNSSILEQIRGLSFEELPIIYQNKINRALMNVIEFSQISPENNYSAMYQIFERINSTGRILEPQEIRNAAYNSSFNNYLNEKSKYSSFIKLYPVKKEVYLAEMLLRYICVDCLLNINYQRTYNLKNTLNEYMALMQATELKLNINEKSFPTFYMIKDEPSYTKSVENFEKSIDWILENIGPNSFRNIKSINNGKTIYKSTIQTTLAETLLIVVSELLKNDYYIDRKKNYRDLLDNILLIEEVQYLLSHSTTNMSNIKKRVEIFLREFTK